MTLYVMVPVFNRERLTRIALKHLSRLKATINAQSAITDQRLEVLAVFSPDEDPTPWPKITAGLDLLAVTAPNAPLSAKFNTGYKTAYTLGADAVMLCGSDDFPTLGYLKRCFDELYFGSDLLMASGLYFADATRGACFWTSVVTMGAFSVLSRHALEAVGLSPMPKNVDRGVDQKLNITLARAGIHERHQINTHPSSFTHAERGRVAVMDVKTLTRTPSPVGDELRADNLWSYGNMRAAFKARSIHADYPSMLRLHYPEAMEELLALGEEFGQAPSLAPTPAQSVPL